MQEHGVTAAIYLDVRPAPSQKTRMDSYLALQAHRFLDRNWPFGAPLPDLYYFRAGVEHGSHRSLHGKCMVVDGRHVLVGSANFTRRGHGRNIEIGVRLDDPELAAALTGQLEGLVEQGALARLPVAAQRAPLPEDMPEDVLAQAGEDGSRDVAADNEAEKLAEELAEELYVSAEARPLLVRLLGDALPAPRVGEDIEGDDGEVIASPELSWLAPRVAVLLPEQETSRKQLEAAGWTCFSIVAGAAGAAGTLGADELVALCELVGRVE
jgi:phosphatidylserine/phosphatidylglycerophosphate/cardiolipin synthase-like enzyme